VRLYTMNGADWTRRYPLIVDDAHRLKGSAILDAEVICPARTGWLILMPCTAASTITSRSPALSTC
ncbi:MAG: hypothetical protein WBW27_09240, partial [Pseudolabrys sp.]